MTCCVHIFSVLKKRFVIIIMENVESLGAALRNSKLGSAYWSPVAPFTNMV